MRYLVVFFCLSLSFSVFSQTGEIERLQKRRESLQADIENTNKLFLDVKKQTTTIIQRINLINKQIETRKEIINVQQEEIKALDRETARLEKQIVELNKELEIRKEKYANAIKSVMNKRQSENKIFFILSGKSFGEALRRMQYLKQYSKVQKSQANEIKEKNAELAQKKEEVQKAKEERRKTLMAIRDEQSKLIAEERNRTTEMSKAQGKQKELQKELQEKQRQANRLNSEIERLIAEEVARQERERRLAEERRRKEQEKEKAKAKTKDDKTAPVTKPIEEEPLIADAETFNLSKNFIANKGRLPMPVTGPATIVSSFGVHKHSEWNVSTNSSGIDIQAQRNSDIRSIFDGEVSRIIAFPGYNNCVILRHGDYYTFYANIINVYVKKGQRVKTGDALGKIYTDSDTGIASMHFQLWNKTTKLDPAPWLKR
ncbi:MAG TPA: peptidoglycan DD-metalloendopeptidase family protein [Bacteroidales bacterium]|nr:peptidoglycan DD-metalloendopeptidase family protein [Bacteroidales bacterium]